MSFEATRPALLYKTILVYGARSIKNWFSFAIIEADPRALQFGRGETGEGEGSGPAAEQDLYGRTTCSLGWANGAKCAPSAAQISQYLALDAPDGA